MEEEIDIDWFLKQEKIEKKYDMFYKANVKSIKLTIIYCLHFSLYITHYEKF